MNKVIRTTVVAGELPAHVRGDIDPSREVTVVVMEADSARGGSVVAPADLSSLLPPGQPGEAQFAPFFRMHRSFESSDEVAAWIRAVRDGETD